MRSSDEEIDIIRKTLEYSATGSTHLEPELLKNPVEMREYQQRMLPFQS